MNVKQKHEITLNRLNCRCNQSIEKRYNNSVLDNIEISFFKVPKNRNLLEISMLKLSETILRIINFSLVDHFCLEK